MKRYSPLLLALLAAPAFAQTATDDSASTENWWDRVGAGFFSDEGMTTLRPESEVRAQWTGLSADDQGVLRARCDTMAGAYPGQAMQTGTSGGDTAAATDATATAPVTANADQGTDAGGMSDTSADAGAAAGGISDRTADAGAEAGGTSDQTAAAGAADGGSSDGAPITTEGTADATVAADAAADTAAPDTAAPDTMAADTMETDTTATADATTATGETAAGVEAQTAANATVGDTGLGPNDETLVPICAVITKL